MRELSANGFSIRKYLVRFTPDELHKYYEDIRNGFWEEWCNRIYFSGDKNDKFKNALLNVVKDPKYDWAFKEGNNTYMPTDGYLSSLYKKCLV